MKAIFTIASAALATIFAARAAVASPLQGRAPAPWSNFDNNVVFTPPADWNTPRTIYARTLQLADKSLLITSEIYNNDANLSLPIFRSTDGGSTWNLWSRFYDKVNGWGMRYQPFLFTLPTAMGGFKAGTILAVGTSIPMNLTTAYIDLYASTDNAKNFNFVSHIAYAPGPEEVRNGALAIWEAFLMMHDGKLVCYYSDQRDWPAHGQKLTHTTTSDLRNWSPTVDDVAMPDPDQRPGMTTIAYSPKSKKYVITFEYCGAPVNCQAYYKVSDDPLAFLDKPAYPVVDNADPQLSPDGSPYVIWAPKPGAKDGSGVFIANGNSNGAVYINDDNLSSRDWKRVDIGQKNAYSRSLRVIKNNKGANKLLVGGAGNFNEADTNSIIVGVVDIPV